MNARMFLALSLPLMLLASCPAFGAAEYTNIDTLILIYTQYEAGGGGDGAEIIGTWYDDDSSHAAPAGSDRLLVLTVHAEAQNSVSATSASYGGESMTKVAERIHSSGTPAYYAYVAIFVLDEDGIDDATSGSFSVGWSGSRDNTMYSSVFLQNVDQSDPIGDTAVNSSTGDPLSIGSVDPEDGDVVIVAGTCGNSGNYNNSNYTEEHELDAGSSTGVVGYIESNGSQVSPSLDFASGVNRQVGATIVVQASGGGGGPTVSQSFTDAEIEHLRDLTNASRMTQWAGSHLRCNINYEWPDPFDDYPNSDVIVIPSSAEGGRTITPSTPGMTAYNGNQLWLAPGTGSAVDADLAAAGVDDNDYAVVLCFYPWADGAGYTVFGAGATLMRGAVLGDGAYIACPIPEDVTYFLSGTITHEFLHIYETEFDRVGHTGVVYDVHSPGTFPGVVDGGIHFYYESLRAIDPDYWLDLDEDWVHDQIVTDTDGDGIPDGGPSAEDMPIVTEYSAGTNPSAADSESSPDGLEDGQELQVAYDGQADPLDSDTDGDGTVDGEDPYPIYPTTNLDIAQGTPSINGTIAPEDGWTEVAHAYGSDSDLNATFYAAWDNDAFYIAVSANDDSVEAYDLFQLLIDARNDGWFTWQADGDYLFRFEPAGSSPGTTNVSGSEHETQDPYDLVSINTSSISSMFTKTSTTYVIEAKIPKSLISEATVQDAGSIRLAFALQDFDGSDGSAPVDIYSGMFWEDPGCIEINFEDGGGGGGEDVEVVGSWTTSTGSHSHAEESGTDRLLVFTIHCEDGDSTALNASAATYGGQSMTKVIDCSHYTPYGEEYVAVFVLNDAGIDAASSSSFGVTWTGGSPSQTTAFSSVFLQNVDQSTPIGANASNYGTSSTVSTSSLSTDDGDMVLVAGTVGNTGSYTVNNGFTEAVELSPSSADGVTGYKEASGANETPSVTHSNVNRQVIVGVVVNHD
jgi:hypothetical protein